ncbi:Mannose-6-phosphate isomerase 1 [Camellia lanceoleosa]|uniref:Mannose-6-phosphate isomerase 1 n=1 Tax=Camellia lanceoleosa TaxID=1840588 RepID=A0ACC0HF11_9ERIC|nr:Mannose-6-phosphate isomerase 1 [Camellia lanceoleosa]
MKPSLTPSSGWALTSPNPPSSSKASMIVSIGSDCVGLSLNSWIAKVPGVLCDKVIQKWGVTLPFMFKVLSISKALLIQAHHDKEFARFLHKTLPDVFKDDNYKPEMALALTEFEALCGFISLKATNFSPAPGVETICFFPKNPSPSVAAGKEGELIVGMKNEGDILIS